MWSWVADTTQVLLGVIWFEKGTGIPEGVWIFLILILLALLVRRYRKDVRGFQSEISTAKVKLDEIHDSDLSTIDKRVIRREEILELIQKLCECNECVTEHIEDTRRLASDEVWKHCPIERCPNLSKMISFLNEISSEIKSFTSSASQVRDQTQQTINNISSRIDRFIDGLGTEFLINLRSRRRDE